MVAQSKKGTNPLFLPTGKNKQTLTRIQIGKGIYNVYNAYVDPSDLKLESVNHQKKTGNPRLKGYHQRLCFGNVYFNKGRKNEIEMPQLVADKHGNYPDLTEADQIYYFQNSDDSGTSVKFQSLKTGIEKNGGSIDPPFVKEDGTVIEGHRRVSVFKLLKAEGNENFNKVEVRVIQGELDDWDKKMLMANYHITKKARWDSSDQIELLEELFAEGDNVTDREIADRLGVSKTNINRQRNIYKMWKKYAEKTKDNDPDASTIFLALDRNTDLKKKINFLNEKDYEKDQVYGLSELFVECLQTGKIANYRELGVFHDLIKLGDIGIDKIKSGITMREASGWVSNQNANDTVLKNLHNLAESISSRSWKGKSAEEKKKTMLEIQKLREALNQVEKEIS